MAMPGGRRHWPEKSGYFDSSNARAPEIGSDSTAATVSAAIALRFSIFDPPNVNSAGAGMFAATLPQILFRLQSWLRLWANERLEPIHICPAGEARACKSAEPGHRPAAGNVAPAYTGRDRSRVLQIISRPRENHSTLQPRNLEVPQVRTR